MKRIYDGFKIQTYRQHELIYEQGEIGDTLYICLRGQVDSYIEKKDSILDLDKNSIVKLDQANKKQKDKELKWYYEEQDIIQMINNSDVLERFKLKREEKLDRYVRQMMKERAKNIEEQRRKEQEKIQFDLQRIENRQKIIQQIIESNKKANNIQNIGRTATVRQIKNQSSQSPSLKHKHTNTALPKVDQQYSGNLNLNKSPTIQSTNSPAINLTEDNNLLLKRYKWKQSTNTSREQSYKKSESKADQSLFSETINSFSESKYGSSLKGSLIFNRLTRLKSENKQKDKNEQNHEGSQQIQQKILEESEAGDYRNLNENSYSEGSEGDIESPSNFHLSKNENKSFLIKDICHNQMLNNEDINSFFTNLAKVCEYKAGDMFGGECFENNSERLSFSIAITEEVKIAALDKNVFEEVLLSYYEERLQNEINFLKNNAIFNKFDEQELEQILLKLESVSYKKDTIVYKEDDESDRIYLVKEGDIEICLFQNLFRQIKLCKQKKNSKTILSLINSSIRKDKKQYFYFEENTRLSIQLSYFLIKKIAIIGPGQIFGESEILKDIKRVTRAKTLNTTNIFYVFDSNQIKFLLENSDLKENLNQARQNKSSWRNQRLKKIQIATKNHQNAVQKMLENSQTQASLEPKSPKRENNQSFTTKKVNQLNAIESLGELQHQINSIPSIQTIKKSLNSDRKILSLNTQEDYISADPYSFQNPPNQYQPRNQSFSHSRNNLNQFYSFNPTVSPQSASFISPSPLSPLKRVSQKFERKISHDFYNNFSFQSEKEKSFKFDQTEKSLSVTSDRCNSNINLIQPHRNNQILQNKLDSYDPEINESYQTLNPKPFISQIPYENNTSQISTQFTSRYLSPNQINTPTQSSMKNKQQKYVNNPLLYYGQQHQKSISSAEADQQEERKFDNNNQPINFNAIDTLTPIIKKSKILDSLSKAFKKQEYNKTNSPIRGDKRQMKTLFIYENQPLQQLYMNCKYNHKKYNIASRKSKRSSSITSSHSKNSRGRDSFEFEKQNLYDNSIKSVEKNRQLKIVNDHQQQQNQSSSLEQRQYSDNKMIKDFLQKNTLVKVGFLKDETNIKINTNIQQKIIQESTSKYRLKAMKQILESSHEIQNLNYLYKHSKFLKYNDKIIPSTHQFSDKK